MVQTCRQQTELDWLADVLIALDCTGLRISELASLRWSDIDFANNSISLTDESTRTRGRHREKARQTKSAGAYRFQSTVTCGVYWRDCRSRRMGWFSMVLVQGRLKPDTVGRILIWDVLTPLAAR